MDSQTYYLKYRPQKVSELDLVDVREQLIKILKSGRTPHALLFAGPRGTGKTSAARIVAKAINCLTGKQETKGKRTTKTSKSYEPCNRCFICRSITDGTSLDLIEIDGASNRGIDDIRNLKSKIKLAPVKAKHKVYIIDEVHMLTTEAFNALLKTLEEPPAHALFILCTTAPEKIPPTILSRCTRFNFRKARPTEIVAGPLKRAIKGEGLKVEKGVLEEIAKAVDGSFRDAHKILEQLAAEGKKITLKETKQLLGQIEDLSPVKLLNLLAQKDLKASLLEIDRIVVQGGDLSVYLRWLLEELRMILLAKVGVAEEVGEVEMKKFRKEEISELIALFSRAASEVKFSPIPQLPIEIVIISWCGEIGQEKSQPKIPLKPKKENPGLLAEIEAKWADLLAGVKPLNHSVEALLRAAQPIGFDKEVLTIGVFYRFHKERLETEKCRSVVEQVASELLNQPIKLKCVLTEKKPSQPLSPTASSSSVEEDTDIVKVAEEIFGSRVN